jgi:hypothetical protein
MIRRRFLWLLSAWPAEAGLLDWRIHEMARHVCANGPVMMLIVTGRLWRLTDREREFLDQAAQEMNNLERPAAGKRFPAKE